MKNNYLAVGACLFLSLILAEFSQAQSTGPQFPDCNTSPISLCVSDEGVRLPLNNKIYLGEEDPVASSCSVHLTQKTNVKSTCGRRFQYEVQLFLVDDTSTAIILQPLTTITTDSAFEAELTFDSELSPDSLISKNGIPYTSGCNVYHRIKWIVTDSCGDEAICEQSIKLFDCQPPLLANQQNFPFTAPVPFGCVLNFFAVDYVLDVKDDCTLENSFLFSLKEDIYQPDTSYNACDIPAYGVEIPVDIWITDSGTDADCNGTIEWIERNKYKQTVSVVYDILNDGCLDCFQGDLVIAGVIETEDRQTVEKVDVTLTSPGHIFPTHVTGKDGKFSFSGITVPDVYTLHAERNDFHKNGVSTLDLVRIQKHLLGIESLSSPYDIIAADANNSQSVSAIDLVEIRKLILGIYTEFPHNKSWRFVLKEYVFGDTLHPWPFDETPPFTVTGSVYDKDFVGIKIGDVNNTVQANAQTLESRTPLQNVIWSVNQTKFSSNEFVDIHFYIDHPKTIQGFQFTISDPELEFLSIDPGTMNLTEENFASFGDKMTMSWFNEDGFKTNQGEILFTVKARAKRNGNLQSSLTINSDITEAEMYGMNDEIFIPVLKASPSLNQNDLVVYPPEPNPWREKTSIPFYVKSAGSITLEIFDLNGRSIYTTKGTFGAGKNEIILSSSDITARGLLYFVLNTAGTTTIHKMIVLN